MSDRTYLSGTSLAGMSPSRSRVKDDFYATPFYATEAILDKEQLHGSILEPAAGEGTLARYYLNVIQTVKSFQPIWYSEMINLDAALWGVDFLTESYPSKFDNVITNPPFSLAKEFAERALEISREKVILFAKFSFSKVSSAKTFSPLTRSICICIF